MTDDLNEHIENSSLPQGRIRAIFPSEEGVEINKKDIPTAIELHIQRVLMKAVAFVVTALLFTTIGAGVAVFWDLNSKISILIGRGETYEKLFESEKSNLQLRNEIMVLESQIRCLKEKGIKSKKVCENGH